MKNIVKELCGDLNWIVIMRIIIVYFSPLQLYLKVCIWYQNNIITKLK